MQTKSVIGISCRKRQKKGFRLENNKDNVIMIGDEQSLKDCIYVIRGQQVVLDYDLAKI